MLRRLVPAAAFCLALVPLAPARADRIALADGSLLIGEIRRLDADHLLLKTGFAGEITIPRDRLRLIESDRPLRVSLASGDRLAISLFAGEDGGQWMASDLFGERPLALETITGIWRTESDSPDALALLEVEARHREEMARRKKEENKRLEELEDRYVSPDEAWSGRTQFGLSGASGNTDRFAFNGKASARRETRFDRLDLSLQGRFAREDGTSAENEIIGDAKLERDFSEDWFVFGDIVLERDEFEDLDLRAALTLGTGFFLLRTKTQELKPRLGLGYQVEAFMDDDNRDEAILSLGYDYRWKINGRMLLTHALTWQPDLSQPIDDYRVLSDANLDIAVSDDSAWSVKIGVRNQYDSEPVAGNEKLDTFYTFSLGYTFR